MMKRVIQKAKNELNLTKILQLMRGVRSKRCMTGYEDTIKMREHKDVIILYALELIECLQKGINCERLRYLIDYFLAKLIYYRSRETDPVDLFIVATVSGCDIRSDGLLIRDDEIVNFGTDQAGYPKIPGYYTVHNAIKHKYLIPNNKYREDFLVDSPLELRRLTKEEDRININHINECKRDNSVNNLELVSAFENFQCNFYSVKNKATKPLFDWLFEHRVLLYYSIIN